VIKLKRKIYDDLVIWKQSKSSMPYMLLGARQVGKTYILKSFCKENFDEFVYINLEEDDSIRKIFEETLNPEEIIKLISLSLDKKFDLKTTAMIIDEIQVSERAIVSLKYFSESDIKYNILCAGSLLGVALNRFKDSFPVGKVRRKTLYPLDFEEFLWALSKEELSLEIVKCFTKDTAMFSVLHDKLIKLYKDYLFVGGMPASILEYREKDMNLSNFDRTIKTNIIEDYILDMSKYTESSENMKIQKIYNSMPNQLGKDDSKFSYKLLKEGGKKEFFGSSIDWLLNSNLLIRSNQIEKPLIPLRAYENERIFKLFVSDVGLLAELAKMTAYDIYADEAKIFLGMLTENYVAQELWSKENQINYWKSSNTAEVDFLINIKGNIIPIEVKASSNTKSKSLKTYMEKYNPQYAIRISGKNFGFKNGIKSIPLYATYLINN
jgi:predicted AAA+ superfamily ATPase